MNISSPDLLIKFEEASNRMNVGREARYKEREERVSKT